MTAQDLRTGWKRLPGLYKRVAAAVALVSMIVWLTLRVAVLLAQVDATSVTARGLDAWRTDTAGPALRYLVCSDMARNEDRDTGPCADVLRDISDFLPNGR